MFATEIIPFVLPSGDRTGLKVVAPESSAFPVTVGEFTGVKVLFDPSDRVVSNRVAMVSSGHWTGKESWC